MRDIPDFQCEYGCASLVLREISRTKTAYVMPTLPIPGGEAGLLEECRRFCRMVGAEQVLTLGEAPEGREPAVRILRMAAPKSSMPETDAALFPVLPEHRERYREIYNRAMLGIPAALSLTKKDMETLEGCYFVHRDGTILGIGQVDGEELKAIASCIPGAGRDVAAALMTAIFEDTVTLKVAQSNTRAIRLYQRLGFVPTGLAETWYEL